MIVFRSEILWKGWDSVGVWRIMNSGRGVPSKKQSSCSFTTCLFHYPQLTEVRSKWRTENRSKSCDQRVSYQKFWRVDDFGHNPTTRQKSQSVALWSECIDVLLVLQFTLETFGGTLEENGVIEFCWKNKSAPLVKDSRKMPLKDQTSPCLFLDLQNHLPLSVRHLHSPCLLLDGTVFLLFVLFWARQQVDAKFVKKVKKIKSILHQ